MAKYKKDCYKQALLLPAVFENQIQPGTFEYSLNYLIDNRIDLSIFDGRYNNDETGAPAYDPVILLKIIMTGGRCLAGIYTRQRQGRTPITNKKDKTGSRNPKFFFKNSFLKKKQKYSAQTGFSTDSLGLGSYQHEIINHIPSTFWLYPEYP